MSQELRLHEELLLLALKDDKGTPSTAMYTYALAGAILGELVLEERVRFVERGRRKPLVELVSGTQLGDPVLDDALRGVRTAKRRATADTWIGRWAKGATMHETARRLSRRGILRTEEKRVLLLFSRTVYPELDPEPERRLVERVRTAVFDEGEVNPRTALLVALAGAADLLRPIFGRKELKPRKARIEALGEDSEVVRATRSTIQAATAAAVAAGPVGIAAIS